MKKQKTEKKINNPHDKFFKRVFGDRQNALDFIRVVVPDDYKQYLNIEALQRRPDTLVLQELKEIFMDIIYECPMVIDGKETDVKVSLLLEHKSQQPEHIIVQLGLYIFASWYKQIQHGEKLSIIIPLVVYHGVKKWKIHQLREYFEHYPEIFLVFLPEFMYILFDLRSDKLEDIERKFEFNTVLKTSMMVMHQIYTEDELNQNAEKIFADIDKIPAKSGFFHSLIVYLLNQVKDGGRIMETIVKNDEQKSKYVETLADKLRKEGRMKGRMEGRKEGMEKERKQAYLDRLLSAIKLINLKLEDAAIAASLNLKEELIGLLRKHYKQNGEAFVKLIKSGDILHNEKFAFKDTDNNMKE